jgi:hypothetical protein
MAAHRIAAPTKATPLDEASGLAEFGTSRPSLFPHGFRREERLTSRLIATLELIRPFAQRFFEHLPANRQPTRVTKNVGSYRAWGLLEPRLGDTNHRADAALALRNGPFPVWRCAFEVKYLTEGRNSKAGPAKFQAAQVERTYLAALCREFDHVITISADQPEDGTNPSGFQPDPADFERTGLSHHSWLKVLWIIRQTRIEDADTLTPAEDRILSDFEDYLQGSNIWKYSREVSLGVRGYAAVRRYCVDPHGAPSDAVASSMLNVATRWLQLTDSIAQRISIETDHLVRANGNRTVNATVAGIEKRSQLAATFLTESPDDGAVSVEVDIAASRVRASWAIDVADLVGARNPQARTRWRAIDTRLSTWAECGAHQGQVTILGARRAVIHGPCSIRDALAALPDLAGGAVPQSLRIERLVPVSQTRTLSGKTIATIVERAALGMAPWKT